MSRNKIFSLKPSLPWKLNLKNLTSILTFYRLNNFSPEHLHDVPFEKYLDFFLM